MKNRIKIGISLVASVIMLIVSLFGIGKGFYYNQLWKVIGATLSSVVFLVFAIIYIKNLRKISIGK